MKLHDYTAYIPCGLATLLLALPSVVPARDEPTSAASPGREYQALLEEAERARSEAEQARREAVKAAEQAREMARRETQRARQDAEHQARALSREQQAERERVREELGRAHRELRLASREIAGAHRELGRASREHPVARQMNPGERGWFPPGVRGPMAERSAVRARAEKPCSGRWKRSKPAKPWPWACCGRASPWSSR